MPFMSTTTAAEFLAPAGYSSLYGFHKYWGKKPPETVSFLVDQLSAPGGLVVDPFLGSGAIARESFRRRRRFIGCDINPAAIELARLFVAPPTFAAAAAAFEAVRARVKAPIEEQYRLHDGGIASHLLWRNGELRSIWTKPDGRRTRAEQAPARHDLAAFEPHEQYRPVALRPLRLHHNSRINARKGMDWGDLFTGRAIHSIELLRSSILALDDASARQALLLVLTAAVGQMSRMVFAIERRGKVKGGAATSRVEVGSWVIGFWTPELHFEVNAWNCFANKATRLLRGLRGETGPQRQASLTLDPSEVLHGGADVALVCSDARETLEKLPHASIDLVVTDPPHGDRIPYLEMSEILECRSGTRAVLQPRARRLECP